MKRHARFIRHPFWLPYLGLLAALLLLCHSSERYIPRQNAQREALLTAYASLDATPVQPLALIVDYTLVWDIEDTHSEADAPLATLYCGEQRLALDRESGTYYCSLTDASSEDWPELSLTFTGEDGIQAALLDDYTFDACDAALREGIAYSLITWTDAAYAYGQIVFSGLPIVEVQAEEAIGEDYVPAQIAVSDGTAEHTLIARAGIHTRGGGFYRGIDKTSYRVEFRELNRHGQEKKREVSLLGIEPDTDWLLIANPADTTAVRNQLCWELWRDWTGAQGINVLESRLCEVVVNGAYQGIYQLMQPIRPEKELLRMGGDPHRDAVARYIRPSNQGTRPRMEQNGYLVELRHIPEKMTETQAFALFDDLWALREEESQLKEPEAFSSLVLSRFDLSDLIDYFLFIQATNLQMDNVNNNVYIWALRGKDGSLTYRLSPWDMDAGFVRIHTFLDDRTEDEVNLWMTWINRILSEDIGGSRAILAANWARRRATLLEEETLYLRFEEMEERINESGAYLRESEKWRGGAVPLNLRPLSDQALEHMGTLDTFFRDVWGGGEAHTP